MAHFGPARQASTSVAGPTDNRLTVQVRDLEASLGKSVVTSPWHVVSTPRYADRGAVTVWGSTLTDAYRFVVDGDRFEALDRLPVNLLASSITWNLVGFDDGRVIVPDPNGYRIGKGDLRSTDPTLLVLQDDPDGAGNLGGPIGVTHHLELTAELIRRAVPGIPRLARYLKAISGSSLVPTFDGGLATTVYFQRGDERLGYLLVLDNALTRIVAAGAMGSGLQSNEIAAERYGDSGTAFYVPLGESLVKMVYDPEVANIASHWRAELPVRGRTGSTPTLVNTSDGRKWVVLIDSRCTVASLLNGLITCAAEERPSQLIAIARDTPANTRPRISLTALPPWLRTVENSPAAYGDRIVVANYSGYLPNGMLVPPGGEVPEQGAGRWLTSPDAEPDFATGVVALRYEAATGKFVEEWADAARQISGVPTISGGANRVYGTGAEREDGQYYLYGFRLAADAEGPAGEVCIRQSLGKAPFREARRDARGNLIFPRSDYQLAEGEVFDAGNQLLVLADGSLLVSGGRALIRVVGR